jgi:thymidine kinase
MEKAEEKNYMYKQYRSGWIEVITGCMFAGKTEELIRRIKILQYAKKQILVIKPSMDNRYSEDEIASHSGYRVKSISANKARDILKYVDNKTEVVAIDEAQFFDRDLILVCDSLADAGIRVMIAGLDCDFRGEPFGIMPELLVKAEFVTKLSAVCPKCGQPATRTQRLVDGKPADYNDPIVLVGASESYEPRCRHCHEVLNSPKIKIKR